MNIKTVEANVEQLLKMKPHLRNSDRHLIEEYMRIFHSITTFKEYANSKDCPTTETIRRTRQKIQALGLYPATEEVQSLGEELQYDFFDYAISR